MDELYQRLADLISRERYAAELVFVNDGSTDSSMEKLEKLGKSDLRVKVVNLRKNRGKSQALGAGFKKSRGEVIITLDSDLQDRPENVPQLLSKLRRGYDVIVGWKQKRQDPADKLLWSRLFNWWLRVSSGVEIHDFNCGLKVMRAEVAREVRLYGELHRFFPWLAAQKGFKVIEVPVSHEPRRHGRSKYGWRRVIVGGLDFLTVYFLDKFSDRPLHLFGLGGVAMAGVGLILGIYLSVLHFQGLKIGDRPLLILAVLLIISGTQLISTGLIAEMISSRFAERNEAD